MEYALHAPKPLCLVLAEISHGYARPRRHDLRNVLGGHERAAGNAYPRGCLVCEVYRLVGQEALGNIARGQLHRGGDGSVGYLNAVVLFQPLAHAGKHRDALLARRLGYAHGLKSALERRVLFNVAAVFLRRRRAYHLHLAAAERGL